MKKFISLSLAVVLLICIALCTPVIATVTHIDATGEYTFDADSVFVFKAPSTGWYAINSYDNEDPFLKVEYGDGTSCEFDNIRNSMEFCGYIFLEEGQEIHCKLGSYGDDEVINFVVQLVVEARTGSDYTVESVSYFYFTADHDDYYQLSSFNGFDPYADVQLPDGSFESFDDENDCEFFGEIYIKKGETIFFSVNDYDGSDVKFKISCDCSEYPFMGIGIGVKYPNIPNGTQFTFKATVEGLYVFESVSENDPYFEYTRNDMFTYSFDDVDYENNKLNFEAPVYLIPGEEIRCLVGEKDGEDIDFSVSYRGICEHKNKQWVDYKPATTFDSGIKTLVCEECSFVFEHKEVSQLKPVTPKASTMNTHGGISVSWNKIDGASKYAVYRRASGEKTWVRIKTTTSTTYLDKTAKNNTTYYYSARAFNSAGDYSVYDSAKTSKIKYVQTPELTGIQNTTSGIRVEWAKVSGATAYLVYRRENGVDYWTCIATTKSLKYVDSSVKSGTLYSYTVRAVNSGNSGYDTQGLCTERLSDPVMKSAVRGKTGITVKWGEVKGAQNYYLYRKTANSSWVRLATVKGGNTVTYVDKTAKKGVTYTYTAKAIDGKSISAYSSTISCKDKY